MMLLDVQTVDSSLYLVNTKDIKTLSAISLHLPTSQHVANSFTLDSVCVAAILQRDLVVAQTQHPEPTIPNQYPRHKASISLMSLAVRACCHTAARCAAQRRMQVITPFPHLIAVARWSRGRARHQFPEAIRITNGTPAVTSGHAQTGKHAPGPRMVETAVHSSDTPAEEQTHTHRKTCPQMRACTLPPSHIPPRGNHRTVLKTVP
jgi:hypothetical protein